jgi:hypothetical protein
MAARRGLAEDPELIERYDQARRLLWSAPCDLRAADYAVRRYQAALRPTGSGGPPAAPDDARPPG